MSVTAEEIDAILPQTQCELCGYKGCMPYAKALVENNAAIDLCPPGGVQGLKAIAHLLNKDPTPFIAEMEKKAKPKWLAVIREDECIGCTKCIQACPVDAILGSNKQMHTVISVECTGCELCVAPCPVDCIDLIAVHEESLAQQKQKADVARERFRAREKRLASENNNKTFGRKSISSFGQNLDERKIFIQEAVLRAKMKRTSTE